MSDTLENIGIGVGGAAAGAGASYIVYDAWRRAAERTVLDGKPATSTRVDAANLTSDADTFQFKSGGDRSGVTDRLQGIKKWNAAAAGKVMVYEYADGRQVIADGHQRLGLAKRLMGDGHAPIKMDAIVLKQQDGWSPRDVRAYAAIKNMHESSGNAIDMARVMRDRPDLVTSSLPVSDAKVREAKALSRLSHEAFGSVVSGAVEPGVAAAVADGVPDSSRHVAMIKEMIEAKVKGSDHARLYVQQAMSAPSVSETTASLFGAETQVRSLIKERTAVLHKALTSLKSNRKLFGMLEREADTIEAAGNKLDRATNASKADISARLGTLVEKLATQRGHVSSMLDDAARLLANGDTAPKAARTFLKAVQTTMEKGGIKALVGDGPMPLAANGGMQRMTDSGDRQAEFRQMIDEARARYEYAEGLVRREMDKPNPKLAVTKNGLTTVMTRDPNGNGFRVTSIRDGVPLGHRDYPNARPGSNDLRMLVQDMTSGGLDVPKKGDMKRMAGGGGDLKGGAGRFKVYHVGKNAYEIRDNVTGGVLGTAKQLGPAMSDARVLYGLEVEGDPHGVLKDKLAAVGGEPTPRPPQSDIEVGKTYRSKRNQKYTVMTKDAGKITASMGDGVSVTYDEAQFRRMIGKPEQPSFLPDATTKEQIAALAKTKGKPAVPQQDVGGLFGDGMKQMDLVDEARKAKAKSAEMSQNHPAGMVQSKYATNAFDARIGNQEFTAYVEREGKYGWKVRGVTESAIDPRYGAATFVKDHRVSGYYPTPQAAADAALNSVRPGWSDAARQASAEARAVDPYRTLSNGDKMFTKAENARRLAEAKALPKSDPTRGMKIEHAKILAGTAWRPDGSAYVPTLNELMEKTLREDQAKAFAQTKRGARAGKKAADMDRIKQQIKDTLGPRGDGKHRHVDGTPITKENMNTTMEQRAMVKKPAADIPVYQMRGGRRVLVGHAKTYQEAQKVADQAKMSGHHGATEIGTPPAPLRERPGPEIDRSKTKFETHKAFNRQGKQVTVTVPVDDNTTPTEFKKLAAAEKKLKAWEKTLGDKNKFQPVMKGEYGRAFDALEKARADALKADPLRYIEQNPGHAFAHRDKLPSDLARQIENAATDAEVTKSIRDYRLNNPGWSDSAREASAKARGVAAPGEAKPPTSQALKSSAKAAGVRDPNAAFAEVFGKPATAKTAKAKAAPSPKIAEYVQSLEKTLGTEKHAGVISAMHQDKALKAADFKAIAKQFAKVPAKSKADAIKKIGSRSANIDISAAKSRATAGRIAGALGPIGVIGAGVTAFDATRNKANAAGMSGTAANLSAVGVGVAASGTVAGVGYGISKAASVISKVAPVAGKVLARALPAVAIAGVAYEAGKGAIKGYRKGGVVGAVKGAGEGALDFASMGAYSHFVGAPGEGGNTRLTSEQQQQFAQADQHYRAIQDAKKADGTASGWSDQARISAYISRVSNAGGTPENLPYGGAPRAAPAEPKTTSKKRS